MHDFGGMVSFTLRGGREEALRVATATELLVLENSRRSGEPHEHPGQMTHASVAGSPLEVPDNLWAVESASTPLPYRLPTSSKLSGRTSGDGSKPPPGRGSGR